MFVELISFKNNQKGFDSLLKAVGTYDKTSVLIGVEDTGHHHFALSKYLLSKGFSVALINSMVNGY